MVKRKMFIEEDKDEQRTYSLVPEGERKFQIVDVIEKDNLPDDVLVKCEDIDSGSSLLHRVTLDSQNKFFWLTKLFLKCIDEPHNGEIEIDTDQWIGRQFFGEVKHNGQYANIKKLLYKEIKQEKQERKEPVAVTSEEIAWDE
jgi:hypothetical protein